jgi:murein L,D-transpeptidase YafK
MEAHRDSEWYGFWRNLKEGYDYFEAEGRPPDVRVARGRYVFASL